MLTGQQQKIFQPLKSAAWQTHCARTGADVKDGKALDKWYRQAMVTGVGIYSTKQIGPKDQHLFDSLCLHFATLAGLDSQIDYWARAAERRALWALQQTMKNADVDMTYVKGIAKQMGFRAGDIKDLPAEMILKLNTAVYKHWKRHSVKRYRQQEVPF